ncbi:transmembrane protein 144-like isoform X1 [Alosa sapidissima]|uniref:transmembrane protein 144-like isoform X1 n=1 Tax=Alosa sapidissima TaxID=34773 RepID=UPI001C092B01|nr:transmembrane protein 144-like isoform X1 [Alosa sapidissima]
MAVLGSLVQACALAFLMQMATAQVYDTSLNLNGWHRGPLVFEGSQGTESNVSEALPNSTNTHLYIKGFIALGFSTIGFGSSLVPIKRTETGNGLFFQWVFCSTMWLESLPVHFLQGSSETWLLSVVAGCLYGIGNLTNVPIIRTIGLGLGFLIWSTFCLLMGWASGRFGWFGLDPQDVASPVLNYIGTGLATVSVVIVLFMKMETRTEDEQADDVEPLLENDTDKGHDSKLESLVDECILTESKEEAWEDKLSPLKRKIVGCSLAAFAGVLYGCCYTPIIFVKNSAIRNNTHFAGASQYDLDYIFPFMTGACATPALAFFVYCVIMKNRPHLPSKCVLPAFFAGTLQFGSQIAWFLSCYYIGSVVTYPIGTAGPSLVSLAWSVFCFREIKGTKNFILLGVILLTVLTGITLISVSK